MHCQPEHAHGTPVGSLQAGGKSSRINEGMSIAVAIGHMDCPDLTGALNQNERNVMKLQPLAVISLVMILAAGYMAVGQDAAPPNDGEAPDAASDAPEFTSLKQRVSYAIGLQIGAQFRQEHMTIDPQMLARGVSDIQEGRPPALTGDEIREAVLAYRAELLEQAKARNEQFLAANKLREGVKTLPSGLQYEVIEEGEGEGSPGPTDTFVAHYRGMLIDGREFDSSYGKGTPLEYTVENMIPGWVEALQKMKRGSKWRLVVPPDLAYGENPPPRSIIPPNAVLVFEMELLDFRPAEEAGDAPDASPQP